MEDKLRVLLYIYTYLLPFYLIFLWYFQLTYYYKKKTTMYKL